ncbi:hypothetical protein P8H27_15815 [Pseudomonas sp. sp1636]|uniref:hypothetical protein n=1 Tax=Pseudomonas sp. sp1636 TaxID=3036707 RepID=UPI0025A5234F|nr:hypothetical protein [Pseudomonas sp. sp1636]MDM8350343.1 hypothetical protein [Pseudomonas sp. sp1636]
MSDFLRQLGQVFAAPNKANLSELRFDFCGFAQVRPGAGYLCYCEGGFIERTIGTAQLLPAKPATQPQPLPGKLDA